jgi:RNA-binding protein YhbY
MKCCWPFVLLGFILVIDGYQSFHNLRIRWRLYENESDRDDFERWSNPNYSKEDLNKWFTSLGKSYMTIGMKGISESHINSLSELLQSHDRVRVRIASDKQNITEISNKFASHPRILSNSVLLEVRRREFMIGKPDK